MPLHLASTFPRNAEVVRLLIEHGADVTAINETQKTALHLVSAWVSVTARLSSLIRRRADVDGQDNRDWKNTDWSITKAETVRLLIEHGADVTAKDEALSTPLHLASYKGSTKTVQLLIEHGADVAAQNGDKRTPLHLALLLVSPTTP